MHPSLHRDDAKTATKNGKKKPEDRKSKTKKYLGGKAKQRSIRLT